MVRIVLVFKNCLPNKFNILYCHAYSAYIIINSIHEHGSRQNFKQTLLRGKTVIYGLKLLFIYNLQSEDKYLY